MINEDEGSKSQPEPALVDRPNCWSAHFMLCFLFAEKKLMDFMDISYDASRVLASFLARNLHCDVKDVRQRATDIGRMIEEQKKREFVVSE